MIEICQAQRHSQKLDLCFKGKPALASEAEVPKGQCKKQTGPEGTLAHQVSTCDLQTACLSHCLNWNSLKMPLAPLWFKQLTSSFLPLPKAHEVKQCWSGLRAPCLSSPLPTLYLLSKCRCRAFIFSTLEVVLYNLIRRALQPWGRQAFEPPSVTKK